MFAKEINEFMKLLRNDILCARMKRTCTETVGKKYKLEQWNSNLKYYLFYFIRKILRNRIIVLFEAKAILIYFLENGSQYGAGSVIF